MSAVVDRFIAALRADPYLADSADGIEASFEALDYEAVSNPDAAGLFEALHYVIGHPRYLLREKIAKLHDLIHRRGRQSGTIAEITGWRWPHAAGSKTGASTARPCAHWARGNAPSSSF
jgi:hypothetical protein